MGNTASKSRLHSRGKTPRGSTHSRRPKRIKLRNMKDIRTWESPASNSKSHWKRNRRQHCRWPKRIASHRKKRKLAEKLWDDANDEANDEANSNDEAQNYQDHNRKRRNRDYHGGLRSSDNIAAGSFSTSRRKKWVQTPLPSVDESELTPCDHSQPEWDKYEPRTKDRKHQYSKHYYTDGIRNVRRHSRHRLKEDSSQRNVSRKRIVAAKTMYSDLSSGSEEVTNGEKQLLFQNYILEPSCGRGKYEKKVCFNLQKRTSNNRRVKNLNNRLKNVSPNSPISHRKCARRAKRVNSKQSAGDGSTEYSTSEHKSVNLTVPTRKVKKRTIEVVQPSAEIESAASLSSANRHVATREKSKYKAENSAGSNYFNTENFNCMEKSNSSISEPCGRKYAQEAAEIRKLKKKKLKRELHKELREERSSHGQMERFERERIKRNRKEEKREKLRNWLHQKKKERRRSFEKLHGRKDVSWDYWTKEKEKTSLCFAIMKSIKRLEKRSIPYPYAILRYLRKKYGREDLTLIRLNHHLNRMAKKGYLKSNSIPGEKKMYFSVNKKKYLKKKRSSILKKKKKTSIGMSAGQVANSATSQTTSTEVDTQEVEGSRRDKIQYHLKNRREKFQNHRKDKIDTELASIGAECKDESHKEVIRQQEKTLAKMQARIKIMDKIQSISRDNDDESASSSAPLQLQKSLKLAEKRKRDLEAVSHRIRSISNHLERKDHELQNYEENLNKLREKEERDSMHSPNPNLEVLLHEIASKSGENAHLKQKLRRTQKKLKQELRLAQDQCSNTSQKEKTLKLKNVKLCLSSSKCGDCVCSKCEREPQSIIPPRARFDCKAKKRLQHLRKKLHHQEKRLCKTTEEMANMMQRSCSKAKYRSPYASTCCTSCCS